MKLMIITSLIILISCSNINNNEFHILNKIEYLYKNFEEEINNFHILNRTIESYMNELKYQNNYIKFISNLNKNYYYSLQKEKKDSITLEYIPLSDFINDTNCISYYLLIGEHEQTLLLCINNRYNLLSLYNLTSNIEINKNLIFQIPISINFNYSNSIEISFSAFDEGESKIYIFNGLKIYSIHIKFNYTFENFKIAKINNFTINNNILNDLNSLEKQNKLLYLTTTLYHGNRYIIYGFKNGEIKVDLLVDKINNNYITTRTIFNMKQIYKIYLAQGFLFIITDNRKKIKILSLLGSNSIIVNCYNFNDIVDLAFDYKNNLLYILDIKGNIFIKELSLSISKAYSSTCNNIYYLQIPEYIIHNINSMEPFKLVMTKNTNLIYILGNNYLGFINKEYELENYIIFNQNKVKKNNKDDNIIFMRGINNYLITSYKNEMMIYKIKDSKDNKQNSLNKIDNKKEKFSYNIIDDNSGIVNCNGNVICKLLFNSFTNNKYVTNTLYITCLIIIISTVYYFKNNKANKKYKSFKEDDLNEKQSGYKLSNIFEKLKNIKNFEKFSDYKKRQNSSNNKLEEDYKDYYGDDDDNEDELNDKEKEENEEEFLENAYHKYVNDMMRKKMKEREDNEEEDEENGDEEMNNYLENNEEYNENKYEERKGQSSDDN